MPAVSIIVPVYNVEKYLAECLDSLLAQTMQDFEIICVNDGSKDGSAEILKQYEAKDSRISVITQKNQGVSAARNAAVKKAKGEYLYFMDSDDVIKPETLEILWDHIQETRADIIVFGLYDLIRTKRDPWFEKVSSPREAWFSPFDPWALFYEPGATPYAARDIFRREMIVSNDITFNTELKVGEDLLYQFVAFPTAQRILFIPDKLYGYRRLRKASATRQHADDLLKLVLQHIDVSRFIHEEWDKRGFIGKYGLHLYCWMLTFNFERIKKLDQAQRKITARTLLDAMTCIEEYLPQMNPYDQKLYRKLQEFAGMEVYPSEKWAFTFAPTEKQIKRMTGPNDKKRP